MVGSLIYLAVHTRPDILYVCGVLSRFLNNPSQAHQKACLRVFQYLKGTIFLGIIYSKNSRDTTLHGYCDADFGADIATRRSVSGMVFFFAGGVVCASSKRQPTVSLSTTEAEYYAYTQCIREALWLRQILQQMSYSGSDAKSVRIYGDNQGSLALGENPELH